LEPDEGEVLIFGRDLPKITTKERYELRTRMGVRSRTARCSGR
jgi:phospholipid/cholesterol/gamma-HCH transport system ATP-binding protein